MKKQMVQTLAVECVKCFGIWQVEPEGGASPGQWYAYPAIKPRPYFWEESMPVAACWGELELNQMGGFPTPKVRRTGTAIYDVATGAFMVDGERCADPLCWTPLPKIPNAE